MRVRGILKKAVYVSALTVCIASGVTACGDMNASEVDMGIEGMPGSEEEKKEQQMRESKEEEQKEFSQESDQKSEQKSDQEKEQKSEQKNEIVSYQYKNVAMSIELPPEWDYEIKTAKEMKKQDGMKLCAIDFWLREKPELKFEFAYWPPYSLGLCGTGVTIEEVSFENGLSAEKYTEGSDGLIWFMLIYKTDQGKGNFAVDADIDKNLWEEYEDDIMKVFSMVSFSESEE